MEVAEGHEDVRYVLENQAKNNQLLETLLHEVRFLSEQVAAPEPQTFLHAIESPPNPNNFVNVARYLREVINRRNVTIPEGGRKYFEFPEELSDTQINSDALLCIDSLLSLYFSEHYGKKTWAEVYECEEVRCERLILTAKRLPELAVFVQAAAQWAIRKLVENKMKSKLRTGKVRAARAATRHFMVNPNAVRVENIVPNASGEAAKASKETTGFSVRTAHKSFEHEATGDQGPYVVEPSRNDVLNEENVPDNTFHENHHYGGAQPVINPVSNERSGCIANVSDKEANQVDSDMLKDVPGQNDFDTTLHDKPQPGIEATCDRTELTEIQAIRDREVNACLTDRDMVGAHIAGSNTFGREGVLQSNAELTRVLGLNGSRGISRAHAVRSGTNNSCGLNSRAKSSLGRTKSSAATNRGRGKSTPAIKLGRGGRESTTYRGRGVGAPPANRGRGVSAPTINRGRGVRAPTTNRGRGVSSPPTNRGRGITVAMSNPGRGVTAPTINHGRGIRSVVPFSRDLDERMASSRENQIASSTMPGSSSTWQRGLPKDRVGTTMGERRTGIQKRGRGARMKYLSALLGRHSAMKSTLRSSTSANIGVYNLSRRNGLDTPTVTNANSETEVEVSGDHGPTAPRRSKNSEVLADQALPLTRNSTVTGILGARNEEEQHQIETDGRHVPGVEIRKELIPIHIVANKSLVQGTMNYGEDELEQGTDEMKDRITAQNVSEQRTGEINVSPISHPTHPAASASVLRARPRTITKDKETRKVRGRYR